MHRFKKSILSFVYSMTPVWAPFFYLHPTRENCSLTGRGSAPCSPLCSRGGPASEQTTGKDSTVVLSPADGPPVLMNGCMWIFTLGPVRASSRLLLRKALRGRHHLSLWGLTHGRGEAYWSSCYRRFLKPPAVAPRGVEWTWVLYNLGEITKEEIIYFSDFQSR